MGTRLLPVSLPCVLRLSVVPLRSAGWKLFVVDDPKVQHAALVFASTELAGEFKDAFEEADRVNKVFQEFG